MAYVISVLGPVLAAAGALLAAAKVRAEPTVPRSPMVAASDILGLRDGRFEQGALQVCVADRCHLGGAYLREEIRWIGLQVTTTDAPHVELVKGGL